MKDIFGQSIKVGDFVAYAVRICNSGSLRFGQVKKVNKDSISILGGSSRYSNKFEKAQKTGTFMSPENIIKFPRDYIPEEIKQLYGIS